MRRHTDTLYYSTCCNMTFDITETRFKYRPLATSTCSHLVLLLCYIHSVTDDICSTEKCILVCLLFSCYCCVPLGCFWDVRCCKPVLSAHDHCWIPKVTTSSEKKSPFCFIFKGSNQILSLILLYSRDRQLCSCECAGVFVYSILLQLLF